MKLTKATLKQLIQEELETALKEGAVSPATADERAAAEDYADAISARKIAQERGDVKGLKAAEDLGGGKAAQRYRGSNELGPISRAIVQADSPITQRNFPPVGHGPWPGDPLQRGSFMPDVYRPGREYGELTGQEKIAGGGEATARPDPGFDVENIPDWLTKDIAARNLQEIIRQELKAVLAETLSAEKQAKLDKLKKKKNKSKEEKEEEKSLKHQ
jgi:hypothetical protein